MATYEQVLKLTTVIAAGYPTFQMRPETVDVYAELLADLDADLLAAAARQAMAESRFFPTIAELRERVMAMRKQASGIPDAYSAWDEVLGEVRRVGYESWPDARWSCELVRQIARRYWRDVCLGNIDDLPTIRAQFRDAYNAQVAIAERVQRNLPSSNSAIQRLAEGLSMSTPRLHGPLSRPEGARGE